VGGWIAVMSMLLLYNNNPPNFNFYTYMAAKRYLVFQNFIAVLVIIAGFFYEIYIVVKIINIVLIKNTKQSPASIVNKIKKERIFKILLFYFYQYIMRVSF
jgi:hypothetical protein